MKTCGLYRGFVDQARGFTTGQTITIARAHLRLLRVAGYEAGKRFTLINEIDGVCTIRCVDRTRWGQTKQWAAALGLGESFPLADAVSVKRAYPAAKSCGVQLRIRRQPDGTYLGTRIA